MIFGAINDRSILHFDFETSFNVRLLQNSLNGPELIKARIVIKRKTIVIYGKIGYFYRAAISNNELIRSKTPAAALQDGP